MGFSDHFRAVPACILLMALAACGQPGAESLTKAIEAGDLDRVLDLLESDRALANRPDRTNDYRERATGTTGDERDYVASRPLWKAAEQGQRDIAILLLEYGADPNGLGGYRATPLHAAAVNADLEMVQLLLDHGADPQGAAGQSAPPFHGAAGAAFGKGLPVMQHLLSLGADPSATTRQGHSPLQNAVSAYDTEPLRMLLSLGADPHHVDENGYTALHYAALKGYLRSAVILCGEGLLPDQTGHAGDSPTQLARQWDYPKVESFLDSQTGCREIGKQASRLADLAERYEFTVAVAECWGGKARRCTNAGVMTPKTADEPRVLSMDLYARGCDLGSAVSCSNLGIGHRDGWLGQPDKDLARSLFLRACEAGHEPACRRHAEL